jgi:Mg2+ and Co2+ transporter CorA
LPATVLSVLPRSSADSPDDTEFRQKASAPGRSARDHGHDFDEMKRAADRLDHYAHVLRRLHDSELGQNWRQESRQDTPRQS